MSLSIWTRCAGTREIGPLEGTALRMVESQNVISTRKLVDTDAEQYLLEDLIEGVKPPLPTAAAGPGLHYLLTTPFRYPPLPHGSRFGRRHEPGLWYGSEQLRTVFAEVAYYRLVFLEGTAADTTPVRTEHTLFSAPFATDSGIDLIAPQFRDFAESISSPTDYSASQQLGTDLRDAGVLAFRYRSARDITAGANVALFTPEPFTVSAPIEPETWSVVATRDRIEISERSPMVPRHDRRSTYFHRDEFLVDDVLPSPAV